MLTPSLNTVMTRLLIVAAVLAAIVFFAPAIFAQEGPIQYTENGTDPVRTFTSSDPEGAGIDWDVDWSRRRRLHNRQSRHVDVQEPAQL